MFPNWSPIASEDLRDIGDSLVAAEIFHIACQELRPDAEDAIEGALDWPAGCRFRRCVRKADLPSYTSFSLGDEDEFRSEACNYILLYRWLTQDEQIDRKLPPGLVILRVSSNEELGKELGRHRSQRP